MTTAHCDHPDIEALDAMYEKVSVDAFTIFLSAPMSKEEVDALDCALAHFRAWPALSAYVKKLEAERKKVRAWRDGLEADLKSMGSLRIKASSLLETIQEGPR